MKITVAVEAENRHPGTGFKRIRETVVADRTLGQVCGSGRAERSDFEMVSVAGAVQVQPFACGFLR